MAVSHNAGDHDDEDQWDLIEEEPEEFLSRELHREWSSRHTHFHTNLNSSGIEMEWKRGRNPLCSKGLMQDTCKGLQQARGWASAFTALPQSIQSLMVDDTARTQVDAVQAELSSLSSEKAAYLYYDKIIKLDKNVTNTEVEDLIQEDMKASNQTSGTVQELHAKLQSILRSSGMLH